MSEPFDDALKGIPFDCPFRDALIDVNDSIYMATKMLIQNRIQHFTAADAIQLTQMILRRQEFLASGKREVTDEQDSGPIHQS